MMKKEFSGCGAWCALSAAILAGVAAPASAQNAEQTLPDVVVEQARSPAQQRQSPATTESVTAGRAADTINAVNTEDMLKYLPSVLVRKRYIGDTQAPI